MRTINRTFLSIAFILVASACGSATVAEQPSPSTSPSAPASASASAAACTSSGPASPDWPAAGAAQPGRILSANAGGDNLTLNFAQGTPQFDVTPQQTTQFTADPSGQPLTLNGHAGALIKLRGFQMAAAGNLGSITVAGLGPQLVDVKKAGDFEGVVSIAVGLNAPGCAVVTANGSVLTFHFVTQ